MIDYQAIGERIRRARKARYLTIERFADLIDRSPQFVGHIERGTRKLSVDTLCSICDVLQVGADEILGRKSKDSPGE